MKVFKKYFSLLYPTLFFLGYWNLHTYYNEFSLDISNYVDTFEIVFSFLKLSNIIVFLILVILPLSISFFIVTSPAKNFESEVSMTDREEEENRWKIVDNVLREIFRNQSNFSSRIRNLLVALIHIAITDTSITLMVFIFVLFKVYDKYGKPFHEFFGLFIFIEFIITIVIVKKLLSSLKQGKDSSEWFALYLVCLIGFIFFNNLALASKIKAGIEDQNVCFDYEGQLVCSDSDHPYIGRTSNSIFLFNRQTNSTNIYSTKFMKNLILSRKEVLHIEL